MANIETEIDSSSVSIASSSDLEDIYGGFGLREGADEFGVVNPYSLDPIARVREAREARITSAGDQNAASQAQSDLTPGELETHDKFRKAEKRVINRSPDSIFWCACGECSRMPEVKDSQSRRCCMEVTKIDNKRHGYMLSHSIVAQCITLHPGFAPVCLDPYVLETAYYQYGRKLQISLHEKLRYTAYRQLVRWCYAFLGRENRVPLPSCVVNRIRKEFPSENYTGFKEAEMVEEFQ